MTGLRPILLGITLGTAACIAAAETGDAVLDVGEFARAAPGGLPPEWKPLTFQKVPQHTRYELVRDGDRVVVRADAEASASGLIRDTRISTGALLGVRWAGQSRPQEADAPKWILLGWVVTFPVAAVISAGVMQTLKMW